MAMDPELIELMSSTVSLAPPTSRDVKGKQTFGTAITPRCHIEYGERVLNGDPAKTKVSMGKCILDGVYDITEEWDITLPTPGPLDGRKTFIVEVQQFSDEEGPHHTTVRFGAR